MNVESTTTVIVVTAIPTVLSAMVYGKTSVQDLRRGNEKMVVEASTFKSYEEKLKWCSENNVCPDCMRSIDEPRGMCTRGHRASLFETINDHLRALRKLHSALRCPACGVLSEPWLHLHPNGIVTCSTCGKALTALVEGVTVVEP